MPFHWSRQKTPHFFQTCPKQNFELEKILFNFHSSVIGFGFFKIALFLLRRGLGWLLHNWSIFVWLGSQARWVVNTHKNSLREIWSWLLAEVLEPFSKVSSDTKPHFWESPMHDVTNLIAGTRNSNDKITKESERAEKTHHCNIYLSNITDISFYVIE